MQRSVPLAVSFAAFVLASCGGGGLFNRDAPDEFAISRAPPLVVPPDYSLVPPKPGAPRPLAADPQQQAVEALFGPGVRAPERSGIEKELLDEAGATRPDPTARATVSDVDTVVIDKGVLVKQVVESPPTADPSATASVSVGG